MYMEIIFLHNTTKLNFATTVYAFESKLGSFIKM